MTRQGLDKANGGGGRPLSQHEREAAPEVYRVALMFGICVLHSITQGHYNMPFLSNVLLSCVDGFAFLSGWFGVSFRPSKVIRLYALGFLCGGLALGVGLGLGLFRLGTDAASLKMVRGFLCGAWFLNAYCLCLCLAPLVEGVLGAVPRRQQMVFLLPPLLLTFGWGFARTLPWIGAAFPPCDGVGSYTGLMILSVYILARLWRQWGWEAWFTPRRLGLVIPLLWGVTGLGLGDYASPFAALLAGCCFMAFRRVPWPRWVGRVACFLGPSMFSVYLLHTNRTGFTLLKVWEDGWVCRVGAPRVVAFVLTGAMLFGVALLIDLCRRGLARLTRPVWRPLLAWVDRGWERLLQALAPERPAA